MSSLSNTHRVGLTEAEILSVLEDLQELKSTTGISAVSHSAYNKLSTVYHKISLGAKVPDYVPNGRKRESKINMDSLGVTQEEQKKYNNSAELSDDVWAQIAIDERKMLEEVAATGNKNVILGPIVPVDEADDVVLGSSDSDIGDDTRPTDNDSVHSLMMALKPTDL